MIYHLTFIPEVEEDAVASYTWYEEKAKGLGEEFLRLFYAKTREIPRNPLLFRKVHDNFRRQLLKRFPYAIYFQIENKEIIIYGLFHCARDPQFIKSSLNNRN